MTRCAKCGRITGYSEEEEGIIMNNGDVLCSRCEDIYSKDYDEEAKNATPVEGEHINFEDFIKGII